MRLNSFHLAGTGAAAGVTIVDPGSGRGVLVHKIILSASGTDTLEIWHGTTKTTANTIAVARVTNGAAHQIDFRFGREQRPLSLPAGQILKLTSGLAVGYLVTVLYEITDNPPAV